MILENNQLIGERYLLKYNLWIDNPHFYWVCLDTKLQREVVIHIVSINVDSIDSIEDNMKMAARLQHPNIVPIFDVSKSDGYIYSIQYFAENLSLEQYHDLKFFKLLDIMRIVQQFAGAIDFIHSQNLVHRHIRPVVI
ncbi:MAG: protein kinase, partial [Phototrophicaceae bacterium]